MQRKATSPLVGALVLLMIATIAIAIIYAYSSSWARLSSKSYMVQVKVIDASFGEEDGNKIITITVWNIGPINATIVAVLINGESVKAEPLPVSLEPGDVIATGTPAGVGHSKGIFLKAGDIIECHIEGIGTLTNPVVAEE